MSDINPYASPLAESDRPYAPIASRDVWREGGLLVMRKDGVLPNRCVKCNAPANGYRLKRTLSWHHPAWFVLLPASILLYVIAALIVRHTARIEIGLCETHRRQRFWAIITGWAIVAAAVVVIIVSFSERVLVSAPWLALVGVVLFFVGAIYGLVRAQMVAPKRIDKHYVWLKRVCPEYLDELEEYGARVEAVTGDYNAAIDHAGATPHAKASALYNRGVSFLFDGKHAQARADFEAVLTMRDAPPAIRAKAEESLHQLRARGEGAV